MELADHTLSASTPFRIGIAPDEAIEHSSWRRVRDGALRALSRPGIVAVLGESGVGKSLLLRAIQQALVAEGLTVCLVQNDGPPPSPSRKPRVDVVLIDDGDLLTPGQLAGVASCGRACVVAGLPCLADSVASLRPKSTVLRLGHLPPEEVAGFLGAQLARSGQAADLLSPEAVAALARASRGVPRQLQLLSGLAVFLARLSAAPHVTAAHVADALSVREGTDLPGSDMLPESDLSILPGSAPSSASAAEQPALPIAPRKRRGNAVAISAAASLGIAAVGVAVLGVSAMRDGFHPDRLIASLPWASIGAAPASPVLDAPAAPAPPEEATASIPASPDTQSDGPRSPAPFVQAEAPPTPVDQAPSPAGAAADSAGGDGARPPGQDLASLDSAAEPQPPAAPQPAPPVAEESTTGDPDALGLPPDAVPRITVVFPQGDAGAEQRADELIRMATGLGLPTPTKEVAPLPSRNAGIAYFYVEDGPCAAEIARMLGTAFGPVRRASRAPAPRPGSVEITLPPVARPNGQPSGTPAMSGTIRRASPVRYKST